MYIYTNLYIIMHGTYQQNKASAMRWSAKHPDKIKIYTSKYERKRGEWLKIQRIFLKILL